MSPSSFARSPARKDIDITKMKVQDLMATNHKDSDDEFDMIKDYNDKIRGFHL